VMTVFVCVSVCLSTSIALQLHNNTRSIFTEFFVHVLAMARSSSAGVAIRYVLLVLWVKSYLYIMGICTVEVLVGRTNQPDGAASMGLGG